MAQKGENEFWGRCINTFGEEKKQLELYAPRMKLTPFFDRGYFDLQEKTVVDIGSGPVSLLLKCRNVSGFAVDPLMRSFPKWVRGRYEMAGIKTFSFPGEQLQLISSLPSKVDEVWIYNVLQHTIDPEKVVENAKSIARLIRIFEWIEVPSDHLHPHILHAQKLNEWLGVEGLTEQISNNYSCYYNVVVL